MKDISDFSGLASFPIQDMINKYTQIRLFLRQKDKRKKSSWNFDILSCNALKGNPLKTKLSFCKFRDRCEQVCKCWKLHLLSSFSNTEDIILHLLLPVQGQREVGGVALGMKYPPLWYSTTLQNHPLCVIFRIIQV